VGSLRPGHLVHLQRAVATALALSALLSGCSRGAVDATPSIPGQPVKTYVALGDSYAAAPYVPVTDLAGGCFRSSGNYPSLVAAELGAHLTDVTCSGADTDDIAARQQVALGAGSVPPQAGSVTPQADLVTITIGGNDQNLFATLVHRCTSLAAQPGSPCKDELTAEYGARVGVLKDIGRRVTAVLNVLHERAPDARIALVGYLRIISATRPCSEMPLAAGDRPYLAGLELRLDGTLRRAAQAADAIFVDMRPASRGHEVCSDDPWINGRQTDQSRALAYHPFAEGEEAMAQALVKALNDQQ
jgi:lysophospholipase L1-like esterase